MPSPHQRVGEYVLLDKIGAGSCGEVWRACHHVWVDLLVAVKIPTDDTYVRTLQQEGQAIHGLNHPNIVRAIGFDPCSDPPYLTMEYVQGTSLRPVIQRREKGRVSVEQGAGDRIGRAPRWRSAAASRRPAIACLSQTHPFTDI